MTIKRVTISLPAELAEKLSAAAGDRPVSAYLADLIQGHLEDAELGRLWEEYVAGVGVTPDDIATADQVLDELLASSSNAA